MENFFIKVQTKLTVCLYAKVTNHEFDENV